MTTMQIRTFLKVAPLLPKETSILLRGAHGIGKSQIVRQVAQVIATNNHFANFEVIDRRLSQMSEGDMIGLPSTDGEVTRFNPPGWYKHACDVPVCLFLDELNRAATLHGTSGFSGRGSHPISRCAAPTFSKACNKSM